MKNNLLFLTIITILMLNGCTSKFEARPTTVDRLNSDVKEQVKYVKYVGDAIVNRYDYSENRGITITEHFSDSHYGGEIALVSGDFLDMYTEDVTEERYYCGMYYKSITSSQPNNRLCLLEKDKEITEFYLMMGAGYRHGPYSLSSKLHYVRDGKVNKNKKYRKIELLYDGMHNGMMLFTYREFMDNSRKPSFYSKVRYKKRGGTTTFSYKSAKIKVFRANSNKIEYVVLSPLRFSY